MPPNIDSAKAIGTGTKFLVETLESIYGARAYEEISFGIMTTLAKRKGSGEVISAMVFKSDTLLDAARYICRRSRRRHHIGLRAVFERAQRLKATKAAIVSDAVAEHLASLAIQIHRRKRRPVMRRVSVGGKFDNLHGAWSQEGVAAFLEAMTITMFEGMSEKGGLS